MKGRIRFYEGDSRRGRRLLFERRNLVVNAGLTMLLRTDFTDNLFRLLTCPMRIGTTLEPTG